MDYTESINTLLSYRNRLKLNVLGMKMPVCCLETKEIVLMERMFADLPEGRLNPYRFIVAHNDFDYIKLQKEQQTEWENQISSSIDTLNRVQCDYHVRI